MPGVGFCKGSAGRKEVGSEGIHDLSVLSSGVLPSVWRLLAAQ